MNKIDFMAAVPKAQHAGDLGLEIGQSWLTKGGQIVTVADNSKEDRFVVQREFGFENRYAVNGRGSSVYHMGESNDLKKRVNRVYIAGPMSGHADLNFPAFNDAAIEYRRRGCFVINPAEINGGAAETEMVAKMTPVEYQAHWVKCMKKDIAALLGCDMIVMLNGWTKSKGATLEHHVARSLGMTIAYPVDTYEK